MYTNRILDHFVTYSFYRATQVYTQPFFVFIFLTINAQVLRKLLLRTNRYEEYINGFLTRSYFYICFPYFLDLFQAFQIVCNIYYNDY